MDADQRLTVRPRRLSGFTDPDYPRWALATYLSDFTEGYAPQLTEELLAVSPASRIGEIVCADVDIASIVAGGAAPGSAAFGATLARAGTALIGATSNDGISAPATHRDCDPALQIAAMANYLGLWTLQHRSGVDSPALPGHLTTELPMLAGGAVAWPVIAPERYERLRRMFSEDPPPADGVITIDLTTGRWRGGPPPTPPSM